MVRSVHGFAYSQPTKDSVARNGGGMPIRHDDHRLVRKFTLSGEAVTLASAGSIDAET